MQFEGYSFKWDAFISHSDDDEAQIVQPLVERLKDAGLRLWYDRDELDPGEKLYSAIDEGIKYSRYWIVVLSNHYFSSTNCMTEFDAIMNQQKIESILPIWCNIRREEIHKQKYGSFLVGILGIRWDEVNINRVTDRLLGALQLDEERTDPVDVRMLLKMNKENRVEGKKSGDWESKETEETFQHRFEMIQRLYENYRKTITDPRIYAAMLKIPRHIFIHDPDALEEAYDEKKPFIVTPLQNGSAADVVLSQVGWLGPESGEKVLVCGAKGGYIQCLLAEILGPDGVVDCISTDEAALEMNEEIVAQLTPFGKRINWYHVESLSDHFPGAKTESYDRILICGAVNGPPRFLFPLLRKEGVLVSPINVGKVDEHNQNLVRFEKRTRQLRHTKVSDVYYRFGPVA